MLSLFRIDMMHDPSLRGARGVCVTGGNDEILLLAISHCLPWRKGWWFLAKSHGGVQWIIWCCSSKMRDATYPKNVVNTPLFDCKEREKNLPYICCMIPRKRFHVFLDNVLVVLLGLLPLLAM